MFGAVPSTLRVIVTIVIVLECRAYVISEPEPLTVTPVGRHTGIWAIKFKASSEKSYSETAEQYAIQHDLINKGVVGELEDTYEFVLPSKQQGLLHKRELLDEYASKLMNDHVHWFEHQQVLKRTSRALMFDDPEYELQWHLVCVCVHAGVCTMRVCVLCVCVCVRACVCVHPCMCVSTHPAIFITYNIVCNRLLFTIIDCPLFVHVMSLLLSTADITLQR